MTVSKNAFIAITIACLIAFSAPAIAQESERSIVSSIKTIKQVPPETRDYPVVRLRALDKITARTQTFEARVGKTLQFGEIFIKARSCRKTAPIEKPEAASFLQIWDYDTNDKPQWAFSGWMFASSPALSAMQHAVYDVWVLDCLDDQNKEEASGEVSEENIKPAPDLN